MSKEVLWSITSWKYSSYVFSHLLHNVLYFLPLTWVFHHIPGAICNDDSQFVCGTTSLCVSSYLVCDGVRHCPGGEDEDSSACAHRRDPPLLELLRRFAARNQELLGLDQPDGITKPSVISKFNFPKHYTVLPSLRRFKVTLIKKLLTLTWANSTHRCLLLAKPLPVTKQRVRVFKSSIEEIWFLLQPHSETFNRYLGSFNVTIGYSNTKFITIINSSAYV